MPKLLFMELSKYLLSLHEFVSIEFTTTPSSKLVVISLLFFFLAHLYLMGPVQLSFTFLNAIELMVTIVAPCLHIQDSWQEWQVEKAMD
jgi:hypothetical protein